jgi:hypothetical protein
VLVGAMIDALLNVGTFAILVLCIIGFGVHWARIGVARANKRSRSSIAATSLQRHSDRRYSVGSGPAVCAQIRMTRAAYVRLHFTAVKKPRQDHTLARSDRASVKRASPSARQPNVLGV